MNENERIKRLKRVAAIKERPPSPQGYIKDEAGNWRQKIPKGHYYNHHGELVPIPTEIKTKPQSRPQDMDRER